MMLDSGSTVSLVRKDLTLLVDNQVSDRVFSGIQVVSASGETIPILDSVIISVQFGPLVVNQSFFVVESLVAPEILGLDFL